MAYLNRRPLPAPPPDHPYSPSPDTPYQTDPYLDSYPYPPYIPRNPYRQYDEPTTTLRGGTLLHKGFYDLLALIPTPSPSRFFWGAPAPEPVVAGPRYEDQSPRPPPTSSMSPSPPSARKGRRISKDMVSKPTGFVYVPIRL
jgi:protein-serine/threonine kinase